MIFHLFKRFQLMTLSKVTLCLFVAFVFFSILLSKIHHTISVEEENDNHEKSKSEYVKPRRKSVHENTPVPNDQFRHLMIFIQISDLHISLFTDPARSKDLSSFCSELIPLIKPSVVLATGDLTDAKTPDLFGSRQYLEEWKLYKKALHDSGVLTTTVWLDIRGNHDNFNVPGLESHLNYFRQYSVQGRVHPGSYNYTLNLDGNRYSFIGVDACMKPGPKRPFNFLGVLKKNDFEMLERVGSDSLNSNMTIWFGHYSTSTMVSPQPGFRNLMKQTGPYLCGHLHTIAGMVPSMYTLQPSGSLELELADWKGSRKFRLGVVDHGLFSFIDVVYQHYPIILVTNPKNALYTMPTVEPLQRINLSTHVRVLVYDPKGIKSVQLLFDEEKEWREMRLVQSSLYVLNWDPNSFGPGLHNIKISVINSTDQETILVHTFSLDGSRPTFPLLARLVLMGHINIAQATFSIILVFTVLPLCILRGLYYFKKDQSVRRKSSFNWFRRQIFKFYLLSCVDRIFFPLLLTLVYLGTGPWFVGELIDGHFGAVFIWGIVLGGNYIPGGLTFIIGIIHLVTFFLPLTISLTNCLYRRYSDIVEGTSSSCSFFQYLWRHFGMLILVLWQILCTIGYHLSYGYSVTVLGFLTTYSVLLALILWRLILTLPESSFPHRPDTGRLRSRTRGSNSRVWAVEGNASCLQHQESKETLLLNNNASTNF